MRARLPASAQLPHRALDDPLRQASHVLEAGSAVFDCCQRGSVGTLDLLDVLQQLSLVCRLHGLWNLSYVLLVSGVSRSIRSTDPFSRLFSSSISSCASKAALRHRST